jgi:hypothetical protein
MEMEMEMMMMMMMMMMGCGLERRGARDVVIIYEAVDFVLQSMKPDRLGQEAKRPSLSDRTVIK